jgi:signal transduction histidine kinase
MIRSWDYSTPSPGACVQQLLATYQAFLGHDLANQLVAIQAFARLLQGQIGATLDEENAAILSRLAELTYRTDQNARRLAEVGRLMREPIFAEPVALDELVREVVAEVKTALRQQTDCSSLPDFAVIDPMPVVRLSPRLLRPVLAELLYNAVAACSPDRPGRIEITSCDRLLIVRDSGRGLTQTQLAKLGEAGSSGVGYLLIRQLVACWQGTMTVQTTPDTGTTVTLLLPEEALGPPGSI